MSEHGSRLKRQARPLTFLDGMLYTGGVVWYIVFARQSSFWWILLVAAVLYPVVWLVEQYVAPLGEHAGTAMGNWVARKLHLR
jgi:hypothetical protein